MREGGLLRARTLLPGLLASQLSLCPGCLLLLAEPRISTRPSRSSSAEVSACPVLPYYFVILLGSNPEHHTNQASTLLPSRHNTSLCVCVCVCYMYMYVCYMYMCVTCMYVCVNSLVCMCLWRLEVNCRGCLFCAFQLIY